MVFWLSIFSGACKPADNWAGKLNMPKRFSTETMTAIKSGILNNRVRDEIVNSLSTLMMVHTVKPTPEEYNTVCTKLITTYPVLKDNCDNGYVRVCLF